MGANEYYTQDFFHNIPPEFKDNTKMLGLFQIQDNSVSAMRNWIGNSKLFFGLFHLGVKSLGPIVLVGIILLMIVVSKMGENSNLSKTKNVKIKLSMVNRVLMYVTELGVINIIFIGLIGFGSLSSIFAEISTYQLKSIEINNKH